MFVVEERCHKEQIYKEIRNIGDGRCLFYEK